MDMILDIFKQLGADGSLVHQFVIVVVLFFLTKLLFVDHLQKVLDEREEKTVNLEGNAEKQFKDIEKIQNEYNQKIQSKTKELKKNLDSQKVQITKEQESIVKSHESEMNQFVEKARRDIESEMKEKEQVVLKDAQELASSLVSKLTEAAK